MCTGSITISLTHLTVKLFAVIGFIFYVIYHIFLFVYKLSSSPVLNQKSSLNDIWSHHPIQQLLQTR